MLKLCLFLEKRLDLNFYGTCKGFKVKVDSIDLNWLIQTFCMQTGVYPFLGFFFPGNYDTF